MGDYALAFVVTVLVLVIFDFLYNLVQSFIADPIEEVL